MMLFSLTAFSDGIEQIPDPAIRRGLALLAPQPVNGVGVKIDTLRFDENHKHPMWSLCSWDFATSLSSSNPTTTEYGITYADDAYSISRNEEGVFTMQVAASKVYKKPRTSGSDPWINFLIETSFKGLDLGKVNSMIFSYKLRIMKCLNRTGAAYNTGIHAAQCLGYLHIHNANPASEDYGKNLWLGVGCYDNRASGGLSTTSTTQWDIGTSTFIYGMADTEVFGKVNFNQHKWHDARVDVKKAVGDAIKSLTSNGFLTGSQVDDFTVDGMNFGWELPGIFDVACQFSDFSILTDVDTRQQPQAGYQTLELQDEYTPYITPVALDFTDVWDVEADIVKANPADGQVRLAAAERMEKGTPVILHATPGTYQIPILDPNVATAEDLSANLLHVAEKSIPLAEKAMSSVPLLTDVSQLSTNSIDTTVDGDGVGVNARGEDAADLSYLIDGKRDHVIMFRPGDYNGQVGASAPWYVQCHLPQALSDLYLVFDQLGGYGTHIDKLIISASTNGKNFTQQTTFSGASLHTLRTDITKKIHFTRPYEWIRIAGTDSGWGIDGWGLRELQLYGTVNSYSYVYQPQGYVPGFARMEATTAVDTPTLYLSVPETAGLQDFYSLLSPGIFPDGVELPRATPESCSATLYNLSGQRLLRPTRGIYIENGKLKVQP